jgi:hypothetical protein
MNIRKKVRGLEGWAFVLVSSTIFVGVMLLVLLMSYVVGYEGGYASGYQQDQASQTTCDKLAIWDRWALKAQTDMVASHHYSQATGNEVIYAVTAGYGFACDFPVPKNDIYLPSATPVPVTTSQTPTLPTGNRTPFKRIP